MKIYNALLLSSHLAASIFFASACMGRWVFFLYWNGYYDLCLFLFGFAVYFIHYIVIFWGYNRGWLRKWVVNFLQVVEIILFAPQVLYLVITFLWKNTGWGNTTLPQCLPVILLCYLICGLRVWSKIKMKK